MVNLLPYRAQRRRSWIRLWSLLFIGAQLIMLAFTVPAYGLNPDAARQLIEQNERALEKALTVRLTQASLLAEQVAQSEEAARQRAQRLVQTQLWETRLAQLAAAIPDSVWLSQLRLTEGQVQAQGHATTSESLADFETRSWLSPGYERLVPGGITRDAEGKLTFSFTWPQETGHASRH